MTTSALGLCDIIKTKGHYTILKMPCKNCLAISGCSPGKFEEIEINSKMFFFFFFFFFFIILFISGIFVIENHIL